MASSVFGRPARRAIDRFADALAWRLQSRLTLPSPDADLDRALAEELAELRQERVAHGPFAPGHFYSPHHDLARFGESADRTWPDPTTAVVPGIDVRPAAQLALLDALAPFASDIHFASEPTTAQRYYTSNDQFCSGDAAVLAAMLRHLRPARVLEVGSGFSSAVMLDTVEQYELPTQLTFIDPYPTRLLQLMRDGDSAWADVVAENAESRDLGVFTALEAGDVLFIDSSHVSKVGSDVNFLYFEVLPRLAPGVVVHVHDIFWPFEYPRHWIQQGRAWNELYVLRAMLLGSDRYMIRLFNSYLRACHREAFTSAIAPSGADAEGSMWLEVGA